MNVAHRKALSMSWSKSPLRCIENMEAPEIILFEKPKHLLLRKTCLYMAPRIKFPLGP